MLMTQKYEMMERSFIVAERPLVAFDPHATTMAPIIGLAKAANVPFYAGYSGGPMFVELPDREDDQPAFFELAAQLGLHRWKREISGIVDGDGRIVQ